MRCWADGRDAREGCCGGASRRRTAEVMLGLYPARIRHDDEVLDLSEERIAKQDSDLSKQTRSSGKSPKVTIIQQVNDELGVCQKP
ncbi:hypothetical protein L1987_48103 [Smallanthus sonchifolius]|uniref:Uncharacterized protein n=1 Tax=Smallanthus sonchifolius TaxID=185202 RepID=A0ACB9FQD6_9ASTR|nr:hypothetical protein L1987_48103 [Smallanthus sonchifolius]